MAQTGKRFLVRLAMFALIGSLFLGVFAPVPRQAFAGEGAPQNPTPGAEQSNQPSSATKVFLPSISHTYLKYNAFGVESMAFLSPGSAYLTRAEELGVRWVRLNTRIKWRALQPNAPTDPIRWDKLVEFEAELKAVKKAGLTPIVIVENHPYWAVIDNAREDQVKTSCAPIKPEYYDEFATFMSQIVARYSKPEFGVQHWELGNEPDVDPNLVAPDSIFGCWGKISDPYYGGREYGNMLKVVSPAIRAADREARIWLGGLLLDHPNTPTKPGCTLATCGRPELFLEGILLAGAADHFDYVPYHSYPPFLNVVKDHDNNVGGPWDAWGGGYIGKATYLRQVMAKYGVEKPLFLNETGLMCVENTAGCTPPGDLFFQVQAAHLVRGFVRTFSANIEGFIWFTLGKPEWRYTALLDGADKPRPTFYAYKHLIKRIQTHYYAGPVNYGSEIEAYRFTKAGQPETHILWARQNETITISVPVDKFVAAYDRDGNQITPSARGSEYRLDIGFQPVYILRNP